MNIWKLGCNWGTGQAYFDNFIRNEKIVLGWEDHDYKIGDIVLIARGFTIIALAKVVGIRTQITENKEYEKQCEKYGIAYLDEVYYAPVEWFDLKKDEFQYELRQGIRQVRSTEIQNKAISLFEKYNFANKLKNNQLFTLRQIADWQLKFNDKKVELPPLQRGFVWKAKQIEDLWDSLLRGFPIGSFLLSDDEKENYFLMDGQQRATAITLGFYNPWEKADVKIYSLNSYIPTLWCDIAPSEKTESHRFVLRLLTQSHPWGYQRKNNSSVLSVSDRNKALEIFERNESMKGKGYTSYPSTSVFPYDSDLPIPLSFLLMSLEKENPDLISWKENVIRLCKAYIPENIKTKSSKFNDKDGYITAIEFVDFSEVFDAIKMVNEIEIHSNIVKKELMSEEEEDGNAENPTLFVRLNSSGTVLNGDELIYSIYKAFFPDSKELVEKIGLSFISAPHIISMVSRIAQTELTNGEFIGKMDVRTFQTRIKNIEFRNKLTELIGENENSQISLAFKKAVAILKDEQSSIIPPVLVKDLIKKNPEVFLLLIYWLYKNPDAGIGDKLTTGILAKFTVLCWFGLDTPKYVKEVWKSVKDEDFWVTKFSKEQSEKFITVLVSPQLLEAYYKNPLVIKEANHILNQSKKEGDLIVDETRAIIELFRRIYTEDIDEQRINSIWWEFFRRLFWGRSIIIFAQRDYVNSQFKDFNQIEDLQDTNVPWDWDHIYPSNWVYYQQNVDLVKKWNSCIGNFRVLSLSDNRREGDKIPPCERLDDEYSKIIDVKQKSFIKENDWEFWSQIKLEIKDNDQNQRCYHTKAIIYRTLNIYREWWDKLMIDRILY